MEQSGKGLSEEAKYKITDGGILFTDTQRRMLGDIERMTPAQFEPAQLQAGAFYLDLKAPLTPQVAALKNPAGAGLLAATFSINKLIPPVYDHGESSFYVRYGVTEADLALSRQFTAGEGFTNLNFTNNFASTIANEVVDSIINAGLFTLEQKASLSLYDWAELIQSKWFRELLMDMAIGGFAVYGSYSGFLHNYAGSGVVARLKKVGCLSEDWEGEPFIVSEEVVKADNKTHIQATLNPEIRKALRDDMIRKKGAGCPVARNHITVASDTVQTNPHIQSLIDSGQMTIKREKDGKTHLWQEKTAIDATVLVFASHLIVYADTYGTPRISAENGNNLDTVVHKRVPPHPNWLVI